MVWDDFFVSIYTSSSAVAVFAVSRMRHVCSLEGLTATYEVESASLRGMGRSLEPAVFTILGTVVFRLIWMATVFRLFPTYEMLMNVYPASWIFTGAGASDRICAADAPDGAKRLNRVCLCARNQITEKKSPGFRRGMQ